MKAYRIGDKPQLVRARLHAVEIYKARRQVTHYKVSAVISFTLLVIDLLAKLF